MFYLESHSIFSPDIPHLCHYLISLLSITFLIQNLVIKQTVMKEVKQQHMVFTNMSSLFSRYADAIHKNQPQAEAAFPLLLPLASSHLCTHQCSVFLLPIWGLHCVKVLKTFQANRTAHIFSLKMGKYILPSITALMWDKVGYFGCV